MMHGNQGWHGPGHHFGGRGFPGRGFPGRGRGFPGRGFANQGRNFQEQYKNVAICTITVPTWVETKGNTFQHLTKARDKDKIQQNTFCKVFIAGGQMLGQPLIVNVSSNQGKAAKDYENVRKAIEMIEKALFAFISDPSQEAGLHQELVTTAQGQLNLLKWN